MLTTLKPINIILFDTYTLALLYLALTWQHINCNTNSNIWQLFYYLVLYIRLIIDEMQSNSKISKQMYTILIFISSFVVLGGMCTYQIVTIVNNKDSFDDPEHKSSCFQNRILLLAQCTFGYMICVKDVLSWLYEKSKEEAKQQGAI